MTIKDVEYIKKILASGLVTSPCLELGVGYDGGNNKKIIQEFGIKYFGSDIVAGKDVDYIVNFEEGPDLFRSRFGRGEEFGAILILNVLEHAFDPVRVLDNAFSILRPGGVCIIITPAVWPLHNYPRDYWRINPNFYEDYCEKRSLKLIRGYFEYIGYGSVMKNTNGPGNYILPAPSRSTSTMLLSRLIHRMFNTFGRGMLFPSHVATGVVIKKNINGTFWREDGSSL